MKRHLWLVALMLGAAGFADAQSPAPADSPGARFR